MKRGRFFVIDGIDGTGKETQTRFLVEALWARGVAVAPFDFPRYEEPSAWFVTEYLNGRFGDLAAIGAQKGSIFFAMDRYAASFAIRERLDAGDCVIANRYVASNMGHQGGKIESVEERDAFFRWLDELEHGILEIPRPDANIVLHLPPEVAQKRVDMKKERVHLEGKGRDLHEHSLEHMTAAEAVYLHLCELFPEHFRLVRCMEGDQPLNPQEVHQRIMKIIEPLLEEA